MISIFKDDKFKKYFIEFMILFWIFIIAGILVGMYIPHELTYSTVSHIASSSASARLVNISDNAFYKAMAFFVNNTLCAAIFALFIPVIGYYLKPETQTMNIKRLSILSRVGFASQMFVIGMVIGFIAPLLNNPLLVLTSLVPHGIIEIPAFLIAASMGLWFIKEHQFSMEYIDLVKLFAVYVIPMIFVAAFLEAYLTPYLMYLIVA